MLAGLPFPSIVAETPALADGACIWVNSHCAAAKFAAQARNVLHRPAVQAGGRLCSALPGRTLHSRKMQCSLSASRALARHAVRQAQMQPDTRQPTATSEMRGSAGGNARAPHPCLGQSIRTDNAVQILGWPMRHSGRTSRTKVAPAVAAPAAGQPSATLRSSQQRQAQAPNLR